MRRMFCGVFCSALLVSALAFGQSGQSLGDVARANREKQAAQDASGTRPKVITNQDVSSNPGEITESDASSPMTMVSGVSRPYERASDGRLAQQDLTEQRAGTQWRERILAQESKIAELQSRIDQLNASIHGPSGGVQYEGPYNRYQARQRQRLGQMQATLDQQKRKLDLMQEAARHSGMHTTVYDP
ncbi:MAG TPA: hypothetical protein VMP68_18715 [Candidatus Eisenbacteria bacterium]|nr:hypothetical protein [Candidatus Eisenbacteria bacterium]